MVQKSYWVGLDAAIERTYVCVVDSNGRIILEENCPTEAKRIGKVLSCFPFESIELICIEAGVATKEVRTLRTMGYQIYVCEVGRTSKFLGIRRQKTDTNDAAGLADLGRLGGAVLRDVHVKSLDCQNIKTRLTSRYRLLRMRQGLDGVIQSMVRLHGGKLKLRFSKGSLAEDVESQLVKLAEDGLDIEQDVRPLVSIAEMVRTQLHDIDRRLRGFAQYDEVCRRLMTVPGVGPLTALSFYSAIEDPFRFSRTRDVGAYLGLTPSLRQSGTVSRQAHISKMGDRMTRSNLVSAATVLLSKSHTDCALRRWGLQLSQRIGISKARIAVARKLSVLLLHLWKEQKDFDPAV